MNLSLILNMAANPAAANPASAVPAQGQIPPEMASFQDFLALMGLSPLATGDGEEQPEGEAAASDPADLAAMVLPDTGNILPPALPVLPVAPDLPLVPAAPQGDPAGQGASPVLLCQPQSRQPQPAAALAARTDPAPLTPAPPLARPAAPTGQVELADVPATAPQPQTRPADPAQPRLQVDLVLPAASQPLPPAAPVAQLQVTAQPVLAQLLQAAPRMAPRKGADEPSVAPSPVITSAAEPVAAVQAATPAPVLPVSAASAIAVAQPDTPPAAQPGALALAAPDAVAAPPRHDFAAVIDKLAEARELARPGRADMHVAHREFGQVSVQFELAGQALKVAMTSADPGFAPAVQAALADRPVAAMADAARADSQASRADTVTASTPSWQAGPQADGQRHDSQQRAQQARSANAPVRRQNEGDGDSAGGHAASRDTSRFA